MREQNEYEVIKELVHNGGNKERAALKLGCSKRSINRHIAGYAAHGKAYFEHGNCGRKPPHSLPPEAAKEIVDLYANKYSDTNFAHFTELIAEHESIRVSESAVRRTLGAAGIVSPMATRKTRRASRSKPAQAAGDSPAMADAEKAETVNTGDAHPRRPRRIFFGEMIQMDASLHAWFGGEKTTLHLAVDDATSHIVGGHFDRQETLDGYYNVFRQILTSYGIPFMFYTDRRTVFEYRRKGEPDAEGDAFTQFSYACSQLGVQIETTSIPQAKGRIERLNGTVQSRLTAELRLRGVSTIEEANAYLPQYIAKHNARFALDINSTPTVFETQPPPEKIDMALAVVAGRKVDNGHSVRFGKKYYRTVGEDGAPAYFRKGTGGLVIRTFSGGLYFSVEGGVFALEEIPRHEPASKNFDFTPAADAPRKRNIPKQTHPWRLDNFIAFAKKQAHRTA